MDVFDDSRWGARDRQPIEIEGNRVEPSLAAVDEVTGGGVSVLLFSQFDFETQRDLWLVAPSQPSQSEPFLRTPFDESDAAFSPDGRWVAYTSNESGRPEVYVTSYPDRDLKRKISRDGGSGPRWSADPGRLFYASRDRVMVVGALDSQWTPSPPEVFVEGIDALRTWDVTPDGKSVIAFERRPPLRLHRC